MIYIIPNRLDGEKIHFKRFFEIMHNNTLPIDRLIFMAYLSFTIIEIEMALCKRLYNI